MSYMVRITGGFLLIAALIILLPIMPNYCTPSTGFTLCIIVMLIFGIVNGFVQAAVFGVGGMLPPKYMGAIMLGNGLSGILMSILKAIFLVALPTKAGTNN